MGDASPSADDALRIPPDADLDRLRELATSCTACPLYRDATQTVFGEGPADARWVIVGEVPGDQEDRQGRPFVGPAGRVLDQALAEVGLDRRTAWVTNAVKHFKFKQSGKRRLHDRPRWSEVVACRPWAEAELDRIRPDLVVLLGATAAQSLLGKDVKVTVVRGRPLESEAARRLAPHVVATVHPSSLLRLKEGRAEAIARFTADLAVAAALLGIGRPR